MNGMARADRVAGEDGGEDALVLGVGDFPHLGVDEVVLHPAEHGAALAQVPQVRHAGGQGGVAAGGGDGAVKGAVVLAGHVGQRHALVRGADGGQLRGRGLLRGQRGAFGLDQHARFQQVEGADVLGAGGGAGGAAPSRAVTNTPEPTRTST